jgi:hypothetical protein
MATITRVLLIDDLDGSTDDVETVQFNAEGVDYQIDLTAANAERLRGNLARFIDAATLVKPSKRAPAKRDAKSAVVASNKQAVQEIRKWARQTGHKLSNRGRIPKEVRESYEAAH